MSTLKKITIGILAHVDAGKTTLSEALLYTTGAIRKLGRVDNKDAFLDTDQVERDRGITIFSKCARFETENVRYTLLDTPGHVDFSAEMERTLSILDYALLVISGAEGVQSHTETLFRLLKKYEIPTFIFVNKTDMTSFSYERILNNLRAKLSENIADFSKLYNSTTVDNANIDSSLLEDIAVCDEALMENFLETGSLSDDLLAHAIKARHLFPVVFGSALKLKGIDTLLATLDKYTIEPSYLPDFALRVYKIARDDNGNRLTFAKVLGGSIKNREAINDEKITQIRLYSGNKFEATDSACAGDVVAILGLNETKAGDGYGSCESSLPYLEPVLRYSLIYPREESVNTLLPKLRMLEEEDPKLYIEWDEETKEINVRVMGVIQLEILKRMIKDRFNLSVGFSNGKIIYKETISSVSLGVGHFEPLRHYAEVHLKLEPLPNGSGLVFEADVPEDKLSKNWQRLVITHLYEKRHRGVLIGAELTDMKITLIAGRAHIKHTEGGDFRQATYRAVRQGLMYAENVLLEPFYEYTLTIPNESLGRAMMDMEKMGGTINISQNEDTATLTGIVPVSTSSNYQAELSAYTKGAGVLLTSLSGYYPCHNAEEVIIDRAYSPELDNRNPSYSVFCTHGAGYPVPWDEVYTHMHVKESTPFYREYFKALLGDNYTDEDDLKDYLNVSTNNASYERLDAAMGTEDVDEIINQTFYANASKSKSKYKLRKPESTAVYKSPEKPYVPMDSYLLVDGYNVIFAWNELNELSKINIDGARGRLLDIMCSYQAIVNINIIVVFDAYRVKGHATEYSDYQNIHVVYTKEAETADQYIERFAHDNAKKHHIKVATSDGLEQIIIRGEGCQLVSSREFEDEVNKTIKEFNEQNEGRVW